MFNVHAWIIVSVRETSLACIALHWAHMHWWPTASRHICFCSFVHLFHYLSIVKSKEPVDWHDKATDAESKSLLEDIKQHKR